MSSYARKQSSTGIYHVMLRGNNQQQIFFEREDYTRFLYCLSECKQVSRFKLYAYCLMGNHVHLLIHAKYEPIDMVIKRLSAKYVYWYNLKYERIGHLFQGRYKSEPIETDASFLAVLRYIHQNPVKAGLADVPAAYEWSSYREYFDGGQLIDTRLVMSMLDADAFVEWHAQESDGDFLDVKETVRRAISDEQAVELLQQHSECSHLSEFARLLKEKQILAVKKTYEAGGSIRQISRLTGCSKGCVERWLRHGDGSMSHGGKSGRGDSVG